MSFTRFGKSLVVAGAVLFLLGLLQGAILPLFLNPRMGLSAHLTAVQSGMALMLAGAFWPVAALSSAVERAARWTILVGMYGLWIGLTLSATTGASEALPMAGAGFEAGPFIELSVSLIVLTSSGLMTLGWFLFVVGLVRSQPAGASFGGDL